MKHETNSRKVAEALCSAVASELGRLILDRSRSNKELTRLLRYSGIDRRALGVPVYKLGDSNENGNVTEHIELAVDSGSRNGLQFPRRNRLPGQDGNL